jgi:hypothetical protein
MKPLPAQPPLWTWIAAFGLALTLLGLVWAADLALRPQVMADRLNLARLDRPSSAPLVVALGASKTRCAMAFDSEMSERLAAAGRPARFVRITASRAGYEDLRHAFDRLDRAPPAVLLLEADLLLFEPDVYRPADQSPVSWPARVRSDLGTLLHPAPFENDALVGGPACRPGQFGPVSAMAREEYGGAMRARRVSTASERAPWLRRLRALQARGTRVILVAPPRSPDAQRMLPGRLDRQAHALARRLSTETGLPLIEPPGLPPQAEFIDVGHMGEGGRDRFSRWLVDQLSPRLPARGQ